MKNCTICKLYLEESLFSKDSATKTGLRPRCKNCESKRRKELIINKGGKVHVNRREDKEGFKTCGKCKIQKKHEEFFKNAITKDKLTTNCKLCNSLESKEKYKNPIHRAKMFCDNYIKIDRKKGLISDLTVDFVLKIISSPCIYCGENKENIGCDRADNKLGHTKDNVVPCCHLCNSVKSDKFSKVEMIKIGNIIKEIKQIRKDG
jgi:hypothetical protein